jgi:hypothetical protein
LIYGFGFWSIAYLYIWLILAVLVIVTFQAVEKWKKQTEGWTSAGRGKVDKTICVYILSGKGV